ncbi:DNA mismatch repair protein MutT [Methanobrevibacter sp. 87.7]|uniref:(deoxy)nucleoside triphosphate pyrophosphohydrolase n=1 Tax=Methanobrevibacter sp. 87.7 TaxID=387957 RepID=UPI000B4FF866|nr:(deoxy)nucleoside triphosphate pyrophosphohydrolase [Methanobrevibacter sp. 87.7]OWT33617.1 DNA mismatch repair protein MutT [Methanobrevibacter sp. 87.7]
MKELHVVAAIIKKDNKILATQRGYGEFKGQWEFPGGKIKENETKEEALIREIKEELNADISIDKFVTDVEYQYPDFYLYMSCYLCTSKSKIELLEHMNAKWLNKDELNSVNWLPADIKVVEYLKELI